MTKEIYTGTICIRKNICFIGFPFIFLLDMKGIKNSKVMSRGGARILFSEGLTLK